MKTKLFDQNAITLDGRLDEPIWEEVKEYSGFKGFQGSGAKPAPVEGYFRILPCEDRIYIGIKFDEPDIVQVAARHHERPIWCTDSVEVFLAPSGDSFDYYHFVVTLGGQMVCNFYSECGNINPDPFAPQWRSATYVGEDYWSAEIELPPHGILYDTHRLLAERMADQCLPRTGGLQRGRRNQILYLGRSFQVVSRAG